MGRYVLRVRCRDAIGIVADVAGRLAAEGLSVTESADYGDPQTGLFFMRVEFAPTVAFDVAAFEAGFEALAARWGMDWSLRDAGRKTPALILVSRHDHCLADLLYRARAGALPLEVAGVISNHEDCRWLVEREGLDFVHVPVTADTKARAEAALRAEIAARGAELVVLARYMQILSDGLARDLAGRCINIHHSFLPSFKGARPYHQAHARGVKLIGATAHYVTPDLDEGPIIAQAVEPVDHRAGPDRLIEIGRDIEARVLAAAVRAHCEGRIFVDGVKTVVLG